MNFLFPSSVGPQYGNVREGVGSTDYNLTCSYWSAGYINSPSAQLLSTDNSENNFKGDTKSKFRDK